MPSPLVFLALALAAYRLTRLAGWDDFPLAVRIRAWVIGERWIADVADLIATGERIPLVPTEEGGVTKIPAPGNFRIDGGEVPLPGKQPSSEADAVRPAYDRPMLAHLIHCPFCVGFWISALVYFGWVAAGAPGEVVHSWIAYPTMPFAISGFVGLVAKNLDA